MTMSTHTDALANVYARSLLELAEQAGGADKIAQVASELEQIAEIARADKAFRELLRSPIVNTKARGESLSRIFANRVTDLTLRFLLVLNEKGRLDRFQDIAAAFDRMVQQSFGRVEVDIFTPAPLGEQQLQSIRQRIADALGQEPVLYPYTEPAMLGGVKVRVGDQLIDGSVASRLRRIKNDLISRGTSSLRDRVSQIIQPNKDGES